MPNPKPNFYYTMKKFGPNVVPTKIVWVSDKPMSPGQYVNLAFKYGEIAVYRVSTNSVETPVKGYHDGCTPSHVSGKTLKELSEFGILAFPDNDPFLSVVRKHGETKTEMDEDGTSTKTTFTPTFSEFLVAAEANSCHKEWVMIQR